MSQRTEQGVALLSTMMKIQAIAFLIYGITFFVFPALMLQTIFGFGRLPPLIWPRVIGGVLLVIALAEYLCDRRLSERLDLAWLFPAIPGLILVAFVWERALGTYEGSEFFFWSSIAVTVFFAATVGLCRFRVKRR
jgi:hypothetical protein